MNCHDVDRVLSEALPLPPPALEHARSCNRCQQFMSALNLPASPDTPSQAILRDIAQGMAANLRPVRPVAAPRYFFGAFIVIFVSMVAIGVYRMGGGALAAMTPLQAGVILGALAVSTLLLAYSLVNQMVPGSRHGIPPRMLPIGIAVALTIAIAALFRFQHEQAFWGNGWACLRAGTPFGLLAAVPLWLVLRRGAVLSPVMTGAAAGLFAGLVGTSALAIHCPNLNAWHILVAHLGVAFVCALAGFVTGSAAEIIGRCSLEGGYQEYRASRDEKTWPVR